MKKFIIFIAGLLSIFNCSSQNIGLGVLNPTKAKLQQSASSVLNLTNALFGSSQAGLSFQQNPPLIGWNQYIDNGSSYVSRWMSNGYGLRQHFDTNNGNMIWRFLKNGVGENVVVPSTDEKIGMQLNYNGINNSTGLGINRAPLTSLHVLYKDPNFSGTGAGFSPYGMVGFESNIDAFINVMSPVGFQNGLLMGSPTNAIRGGILYTHAANTNLETLALRTGGNFNRVVISAAGNVAIGDFIASNKLDVDGAVSFMGADIDINTCSVNYVNGNASYYQVSVNNRSYCRIVNASTTCCQWINGITPGTKIGQIIFIEIASDVEGITQAYAGSNIEIPSTSIIGIAINSVFCFIWNGTKWILTSYSNND